MIEHSFQKNIDYLVFTDLDGTLLDHHTYSFAPALPALNALKEKHIPLVICTSKTRAEIEATRQELANRHPFISENGGAIFIPKNYFPYSFSFDREDSQYFIVELGTPYAELRKVFGRMQALLPGRLRGFADFTEREVADLCGFSLSHAVRAKKREYDEPFILDGDSEYDTLQKVARRSHLRLDRGGRFYHLTGQNDKGKAVTLLKEIYGKGLPLLKTVGLGDSFNDVPMLKVVDHPVVVQKPDGSYDPSIALDNLIFAPAEGPSGWCTALLELLKQNENREA